MFKEKGELQFHYCLIQTFWRPGYISSVTVKMFVFDNWNQSLNTFTNDLILTMVIRSRISCSNAFTLRRLLPVLHSFTSKERVEAGTI